MGSEPATQDWELVVSSDLASSLIPHGQLRRMQRPVDDRMLPPGAYRALVDSVGRQGLEDMLLVPAVLRPVGHRWRHRRLYSPLCVLGIGDRGLGLWVEAPSPGIQMALPFPDIAAIERDAAGSWRRLTVIGREARFCVWYQADGDASADIWTRRLRQRVANRSVPLPTEPHAPRSQPMASGPEADHPDHLARPHATRPFLISPDDDVVASGHSLAGATGASLLAVTARETIVVTSTRALRRPWHVTTRALYVPRAAVTDTAVGPRSLVVHSAGAEIRARLCSRTAAAAAARWFRSPAASRRPTIPEQRNIRTHMEAAHSWMRVPQRISAKRTRKNAVHPG